MGIFRTLSTEEVARLLAAFGVEGYLGHRPIAAGTVNTNVAVDTGRGLLFLRVNEGKAQDDVEREAAIVNHVAARGLPTPAPLPAATGKPFARLGDAYVSLFPWVQGRVLDRSELQAAHARAAGEALARLHLAGADLPDRRPGRYEPDEILRRHRGLTPLATADPVLAEATAILGPELEGLGRERRDDLPLGLIHGDLFVDNVLYRQDGTLAALLDFEQASWGRLAYDVAVSLLAFGYGRDDFRPDVTRAFLSGYAAVRSPLPQEEAGLGAELCFAACRFAVTRITDVYLRRAKGAPPGKDFRRYLARLASVRTRLAAGDRLLTFAG